MMEGWKRLNAAIIAKAAPQRVIGKWIDSLTGRDGSAVWTVGGTDERRSGRLAQSMDDLGI